MRRITFCPNPRCPNHEGASGDDWYVSDGSHHTKAFGEVPRFQCVTCRKTFSTQTFALDYYAKRVVNYRNLVALHSGSMSLRGAGRALGVNCTTVQNRLDRLCRQALALHAELRPRASAKEEVCVDGFVSFDVSQYFPNEITIATTAESRFVYDLSHATRKRSGNMTETQKKRAAALYSGMDFEKGAVRRTFSDVLGSLASERPPVPERPLVLVTDEKKEYAWALQRWELFRKQDEEHRVLHRTVNSKAPRTFQNPLFASNYLDREIRKDQANHHRESTCFTRNVANGMSRLALYCINHSYRKKYLIKAPVADVRVHAEVAGIERTLIDKALRVMFRDRRFLTKLKLPPTLEKIWRKKFVTPLAKRKTSYLPAFAFG